MRPDLPTVAESGVPGFATGAWFRLFGPANMPPALVTKLHADVSKGLDSPQTRQFFEQNGFERVEGSPREFAQLIQNDLKHWGALIKMLGVQAGSIGLHFCVSTEIRTVTNETLAKGNPPDDWAALVAACRAEWAPTGSGDASQK